MGAQLCALMPPKVNAALSALMLLKRAVGGAGFLLPLSEAAVQSREDWFYNGRVALHRSLTRHRLHRSAPGQIHRARWPHRSGYPLPIW